MSRDEIRKTVEDIYIRVSNESLEKGDVLLNTLHEIQDHYNNFIPVEAAEELHDITGVPLSKIYEVLSFYTMFSTEKRGQYVIRICKSLPCHVDGGAEVVEALKEKLGINFGETTEDGVFTLEQSSCLGLCGVSPVMMINEEAYGNLTPEKVKTIIDDVKDGKRSDVNA